MSTTLREQVADAIAAVQLAWYTDDRKPADGEGLPEELADAVLAVLAKYERDDPRLSLVEPCRVPGCGGWC